MSREWSPARAGPSSPSAVLGWGGLASRLRWVSPLGYGGCVAGAAGPQQPWSGCVSGARRLPALLGPLCTSALTGEERCPWPDHGALKNAAELKCSKLIKHGRQPWLCFHSLCSGLGPQYLWDILRTIAAKHKTVAVFPPTDNQQILFNIN